VAEAEILWFAEFLKEILATVGTVFVVVRGESPTKIHKNESMVNLRKTEFVARISLRNSVNKTRADKSYKRSLT